MNSYVSLKQANCSSSTHDYDLLPCLCTSPCVHSLKQVENRFPVCMFCVHVKLIKCSHRNRGLIALDRHHKEQIPELPTISITQYASKYKVDTLHHVTSFTEVYIQVCLPQPLILDIKKNYKGDNGYGHKLLKLNI